MAKPKKNKTLLTAPFAIHNPSRHKRAMLLDALKRSHLAYTKALAKFLPRAAELKEDAAGKSVHGKIANRIAKFLKPLPLSSGAKKGIGYDLAADLLSYLALREEDEKEKAKQKGNKAAKKERPPRRPPKASRINDSADEFDSVREKVETAITLEETRAAQDALFSVQRMGKLRPLSFVENDYSTGFLLLYSPEKSRFFIWLNLHPRKRPHKSRFASPIKVEGLVNVRECARKGLPFEKGDPIRFTSETGAIFPVDFGGDYQMKRFIERGDCHPQSAKLIHRREADRFEVMITFEFTVPAIATENYLGIDRGMDVLAALCVVDKNGAAMEAEMHGGEFLRQRQKEDEERQKEMQKRGKRYSSRRRSKLADAEIHTIANSVVEMAQRNRAQVVMENLEGFSGAAKKPKGGGRAGRGFRRGMNRRQYAKFARFLEYKLPIAGLPKPVSVAAAYTSQTCPECGHWEKANRPIYEQDGKNKRDRFECQKCRHCEHADANAARVIALKKMWWYNLPERIRKEIAALPKGSLKKFFADLSKTEHGFVAFLRNLRGKRQKGAD